MRIVGRRAEQQMLARLEESTRPEFLALYGRRRVGKTFLIREYFSDRLAFDLTGTLGASRTEQLASFDRAAERRGVPSRARSWAQAFETLRSLLEADQRLGKKIVFLDELPWLATKKSGLLEALGHFWNSWGSTRPDLLLIVCGSSTSWMVDRLLINQGGLHNRLTANIFLQPFTLGECEEFLRDRGLVMNRYQQVESYMIFGGIPAYLTLLQPHLGLAQNVDALCFASGGVLRTEFENLYGSLFAQPYNHVAIIRALAGAPKGLTREEVLAITGLPKGGGATKALSDLVRSGFVRQYQGFGKKRRDALIQLVDPFTLFSTRFLGDDAVRDPRYWSNSTAAPRHAAWSGLAFEKVALLHTQQIRKALGIEGVLTDIGSWTGSSGGERAQIDLVLDRADHIVDLCEMKFTIGEYSVSAEYERKLVRKRSVFAAATGTRKAVRLVLVTTYGLIPGVHAGAFQAVVTMDDLFAQA
ncbi:MAG: hypothetical protein LBE83_01650 [Propionibacteriaceae bacterium]|jgi:hypothetical protein|nr:hypothetical protein [Propionibacteriaceae bacterium]